ncbi:MAG TPA: DUF982 domain-containing protein [Mesorhizobium sp.]|jgi:hypothetical protein|uniref:DUF982 domain-containing protein n=1 Tax=Mesorhizobium sp. TaxID=1871066 RepID=UPI002DDD4164|nr:DUF982 domain-containing protein [Mesorhizobium sp.]HEV2507437.1 DUF982 domain-containing protein [Mesorhizobium sp.]
MHNLLAFKHVVVTAEVGDKREISSLCDMIEFLTEWAKTGESKAWEIAMKACNAARARELDPQIAHNAFIAFARRSKILVPEDTKYITVKPSVAGFGGFAM